MLILLSDEGLPQHRGKVVDEGRNLAEEVCDPLSNSDFKGAAINEKVAKELLLSLPWTTTEQYLRGSGWTCCSSGEC